MDQDMRRTAGLALAALALVFAAWCPAGPAAAQGGEGLSPTLAAIKARHVVHLGYRESSPPFSFLDQANRPIGYSLELCEAIVDEIANNITGNTICAFGDGAAQPALAFVRRYRKHFEDYIVSGGKSQTRRLTL